MSNIWKVRCFKRNYGGQSSGKFRNVFRDLQRLKTSLIGSVIVLYTHQFTKLFPNDDDDDFLEDWINNVLEEDGNQENNLE